MTETSKKSPTWKVLGILFLLIGMPILWVMLNKTGVHYSKSLPLYPEKELDANGDTIYHSIGDFKLLNQYGDSVSLETFKDKILLVSFFYASSDSASIQMNGYMGTHIYREFEKDTNIRFLSFTGDPVNDSPAVLLKHAQSFNAQSNWQFITGSKAQIYEIAANIFKIPGVVNPHNGLFLSNKIVIVDKKKRVRGVFDTNGQNEKSSTIDAVRALKLEYKN